MTLREMREAKGLTQFEVGIQLKTQPGTVGNWERGTQEPRIAQIQALAKLYGVSTDEIIRAVQEAKSFK